MITDSKLMEQKFHKMLILPCLYHFLKNIDSWLLHSVKFLILWWDYLPTLVLWSFLWKTVATSSRLLCMLCSLDFIKNLIIFATKCFFSHFSLTVHHYLNRPFINILQIFQGCNFGFVKWFMDKCTRIHFGFFVNSTREKSYNNVATSALWECSLTFCSSCNWQFLVLYEWK